MVGKCCLGLVFDIMLNGIVLPHLKGPGTFKYTFRWEGTPITRKQKSNYI